ncbi:MAG: hypothetical protein ACREMM_06950 [Gemmatimonadales bacterium]
MYVTAIQRPSGDQAGSLYVTAKKFRLNPTTSGPAPDPSAFIK